jgi:GT2 family glycosyltransferase
MPAPPKISVVIAADDHPPDLDRFLGALISQTAPPADYEIIIVDAALSDDYGPAYGRALSRKPAELRLHYERIAKGGRAKSCNHALLLARAPIILFLADDSLASPRTVEAHLRFHEQNPENGKVGIGSTILPPEFRTHFSLWLEQSGSLFGIPFSDHMTSVPAEFFYAGNTSVKRDLLLQAGPFDENFRYHVGDDYELGLRLRKLGMHAVFLPDARVEHFHNLSLEERCKAMNRAGQSSRVFERLHPGYHFWHIKCLLPPWCYEFYGRVALLRYRLSLRERHLIPYYRAKLDASFVAGYRDGPP